MTGSPTDNPGPDVPQTLRGLAARIDPDLYLVGGYLRDSLIGRHSVDVDAAIDAEVAPIALEIDPGAVLHERFGTATVRIGELVVDLARTRRERYPQPGALPEVEPAGIEEDLSRRDFTINAMALRIGPDPEHDVLLDPHGGLTDLNSATLRLLHPGSIADDPTRALRGARYAARLELAPSASTEDQLVTARLDSVSADRVRAELELIAAEPDPAGALRQLTRWGLLAASEDELQLVGEAIRLTADPVWAGLCTATEVVGEAIGIDPLRSSLSAGELGAALAELRAVGDPRPSAGVAAAAPHKAAVLALARASGAKWLDRWASEWRHVTLEITGEDLIEAGIPSGPAIGAGLAAARTARLDGGAPDRESQLELALATAREAR